MVLRNETVDDDGDLFPSNLRNKPLFVVNGGRDPLYPTSVVSPYVEHLQRGGVEIVYRPQPDAAHDTSWWPQVVGAFEQFVSDHPRTPLPDSLTWESGPPNIPSRVHWLIVDRLARGGAGGASLPDVNDMPGRPALDFGIRSSGTRINRVVRSSNAEGLGLRPGDAVLAVNNQTVSPDTDVAELLRAFPSGRPLIVTVARGGESVRLTGRYAPTVLPGEADAMFPRQRESGRVDLTRSANRIDVRTKGVAAFTLLLSPEQFDFERAIVVVVNGRSVFDGRVRRDVRSLLTWAARDTDRAMLFAAELPIVVRE
jgi:membrane-associated protease RseP (regulator of RpoE activity)